MNNKEFLQLLKRLNACHEAIAWVGVRNWHQVYHDCDRGDWLMWLFCKTNPDDKRLRHLVAGHQANTVRHLMADERSTKAVDAAIAFGMGKITQEELNAAKTEAAAAAEAAYAADRATKTYTQKETTDIFKKYVPIEKFNI